MDELDHSRTKLWAWRLHTDSSRHSNLLGFAYRKNRISIDDQATASIHQRSRNAGAKHRADSLGVACSHERVRILCSKSVHLKKKKRYHYYHKKKKKKSSKKTECYTAAIAYCTDVSKVW